MELVRVKREGPEWDSVGEEREPERLTDLETQHRVDLLTEHIKLESDFKEEPASEDEEPMNWKQEPDPDSASSCLYHDNDRLSVKLESDFKDVPSSEVKKPMSVKQEPDSDSPGSDPDHDNDRLSVKLESDFKEEPASEDEEPMNCKQEPDPDSTGSYSDHENDRLSKSNQTVHAALPVQETSSTLADQSRAGSNPRASGERQTSDTDVALYECGICGEKFTQIKHLSAHLSTNQSNDKPSPEKCTHNTVAKLLSKWGRPAKTYSRKRFSDSIQ